CSSGTRPGRAVSTRSEHGRGRLHEGNLDADERNYRRADSLVVEWHDAARSRDQPPPEESRPEPESQVVEVASPSTDAEKRPRTLWRVGLKGAQSATRAPEHVQGPPPPPGPADGPPDGSNGPRGRGD